MKTQKYISLALALAMVGSFALALPALAQTNTQFNRGSGTRGGRMGAGQGGLAGTVSAISGNTITITARQGFNSTAAAKTYTVDATNAKVTKNNEASTVANIAVGDTVIVQGKISGTTVTATNIRDGVMSGLRAGMGVVGSVSAISGTTLTVTTKAGPNGAAAATYTVDASSATVTKNGQASAVSNIAVGDNIMVQGTVTGTNVVAKTIRDGLVQGQPAIQGNGQPVVAGKVSAISGNTITITNNSNVTYTIDATSAKVSVTGVTSATISNVAVGDNIIVQGAVNGNSITASSVIDQKVKTNNSANNTGSKAKPQTNVLGGVVNFFKHLFGF